MRFVKFVVNSYKKVKSDKKLIKIKSYIIFGISITSLVFSFCYFVYTETNAIRRRRRTIVSDIKHEREFKNIL